MTEREREVIRWMQVNRDAPHDTSWYTDQIGTSARLLSRLGRQGLVIRDDPDTNPLNRKGTGAVSWRLSLMGRSFDPDAA